MLGPCRKETNSLRDSRKPAGFAGSLRRRAFFGRIPPERPPNSIGIGLAFETLRRTPSLDLVGKEKTNVRRRFAEPGFVAVGPFEGSRRTLAGFAEGSLRTLGRFAGSLRRRGSQKLPAKEVIRKKGSQKSVFCGVPGVVVAENSWRQSKSPKMLQKVEIWQKARAVSSTEKKKPKSG